MTRKRKKKGKSRSKTINKQNKQANQNGWKPKIWIWETWAKVGCHILTPQKYNSLKLEFYGQKKTQNMLMSQTWWDELGTMCHMLGVIWLYLQMSQVSCIHLVLGHSNNIEVKYGELNKAYEVNN